MIAQTGGSDAACFIARVSGSHTKNIKSHSQNCDFRENSARLLSIVLVFTIRICYIGTRTKLPERILAFHTGQRVQFKQEVLCRMKYECVCGYVYDPEVGDPDNGIAPGTAFEDLPEDWVCPVCGMDKEAFTAIA